METVEIRVSKRSKCLFRAKQREKSEKFSWNTKFETVEFSVLSTRMQFSIFLARLYSIVFIRPITNTFIRPK